MKKKLNLKDGGVGPVGPKGDPGKSIFGPKGDKGDQGQQGIPGMDGLNGLDGRDGSPDTRLQIVEKINTGSENDVKIKATQVEGFNKSIDDVARIDRALSILDQRTQFLINKQTSASSSGVTSFTSPNNTLTVGGTTSLTADLNLSHSNTWLADQKINVNSASALVVEQTGVFNNTLVVDTSTGRVGIGLAPSGSILHILGTQPATNPSGNGTGADTVTVQLGDGGNSTQVAGNPTGGLGAAISFSSGSGGVGINGTTQNRGAIGGNISFSAGSGGSPGGTGAVRATGANGGGVSFSAGFGGATSTVNGNSTGGAGGTISFVGRVGGNALASGAPTTITGGAGSPITFVAGDGGTATGGGTTNTAGNGGSLTYSAGIGGIASGGGTNIQGSNGGIVFNINGSNASVVLGAYSIYSGGTLRYQVNATGQAWFAATPVAQQSGDIGTALTNYGLITSPTLAAASLTGTTLPASIVNSSLTSVGTIVTGVWHGTAIANAFLANSTISGVSLGGTLAALTAGDGSLTFSGSYTGATARTIILNMSNANTWTRTQTFNGGVGYTYVQVGGTYSVLSSDYTVDCKTGTFTVTLPSAVGITGQVYEIKNSGTGVITVATTSSQTIDGVTTQTLAVQYQTIIVQSTGSAWIIL